MKTWCHVIAVGLLMPLSAWGQPVIDGSAADVLYGAALVVQDTQTGFGDANLGRPDVCNGSELDAAYGVVYGDRLYLVLAGNFETNGNKLELFFDTRPGGQNRLLAQNPGQPNVGLKRMCDDGSGNGLTFAAGFEADFWVSVASYGDPTDIFVDYAELYVDPQNPGVLYYCGVGKTKCQTVGGALVLGDPGAPAILCTVDNSNVAGVTGGYGVDDGSGVLTGVEIAIPLSALGNPMDNIRVCAFINGQQHDWVSNQLLGGIFGIPSQNLGEPRLVNLSTTLHQPFTVPIVTVPVGACCVGQVCTITTQAACTGTYLGDNSDCDGNPCDTIPSGRCCIDDGYAGRCEVMTEADCQAEPGFLSWTAGQTCEGCPCLLPPKGACCIGGGCSVLTEAECTGGGGVYAGNYTNCGNDPCDFGACCTEGVCTEVYRFECLGGGGRFIGPGTVCTPGLCEFTIETPYVAGSMQGWDPDANPMTETAPGSHIWELTFTGLDPNARYEFKITDGTWGNSLPRSGNSWCFTNSAGEIKITYDANYYEDGWLPKRDRLPLPDYSDPGTWTAVGDWQGWNNANPATAMAPQGGGIYKYEGTGLAVGNHLWKAVRTGTWDAIGNDNRSVNADSVPFTVTSTSEKVRMYVNALVGTVRTEVIPPICIGDLNCDGQIDFGDINPFVLYLSNFNVWQSQYPGCDPLNGDINGNGVYGQGAFDDINPFVALLSSAPLPIPCP